MPLTDIDHLSRRALIGRLIGLAAFALPGGALAAPGSGVPVRPKSFLSTGELQFLAAIADTIIPATETPGAIGAGVPKTVQLLLSKWASVDTRGRWRTNLALLSKELGIGFVHAQPAAREARLGLLDAAVFAQPNHRLSGYRDIKNVIATAYYLSEPGATVELDYLPVPGDWMGDVPVRKNWAA